MRITPNTTINNSLYNIQTSRSILDSLQEKIASGKNYNRVSDDPVMARMLIGINDRFGANEQFKSNIDKANIWMKTANTALTGMSATMKEIKSLVATIPIDNQDPLTRENIAYQLTLMREQLADMANSQLDNQYLFAGTDTTTVPYSRSVKAPPVANSYLGNDGVTKIQIDVNATEELNIPGSSVLGGGTPPGGKIDILYELDNLVALLKAGPVSTADRVNYANLMEKGAKQVQTAQTTVSTRIKRLDLMATMNTNSKNTMETVFSDTQNVDYAKLGVQLGQQKIAFEATLSATAKVSQMSLLDYL